MKPPVFKKTIRENDVVLELSNAEHCRQFMEADGNTYLDVSKPLSEKQLLNALSQAYALGYENAVEEAQNAVKRVLYERKTEHAPKAIIAETTDFRTR